MQKLKLDQIITPSRETLKWYLDKRYIFKTKYGKSIVLKDISYNYSYRYLYNYKNKNSEELQGMWTNNTWEVYKLPKTLINFKKIIQCN